MDIDTLINSVDTLPATPQLLPKMQTLLNDPDSSIDEISELIKMEGSLASQLIKVANSAYYGSSTRCTNVVDALNRVGFQEAFKLIGMLISKSMFAIDITVYSQDRDEMWEDAIVTAACMETVGVSAGVFSEQYYTTGLLHSIGKLVINAYHTAHGLPGYKVMDGPLDEARERQLLGFTNAEVAGAVLDSWNFPGEIRTPILYKYRPDLAVNHRTETITLSLVRELMHILENDGDPYVDFEPKESFLEETHTSFDVFVGSANTGYGLAKRLLSIVSDR